ncbi:hypothetical protein SUDANB32_01921 [Streptomyces sp. enrichment culture]
MKAYGVGPWPRRCSSRDSASAAEGRWPAGTHHSVVMASATRSNLPHRPEGVGDPHPPPAEHLPVPPLVHERRQRFRVPPHRHVDDQQRVVEDGNGRGVAVVAPEPPHETVGGVRAGVDRVEVVDEVLGTTVREFGPCSHSGRSTASITARATGAAVPPPLISRRLPSPSSTTTATATFGSISSSRCAQEMNQA